MMSRYRMGFESFVLSFVLVLSSSMLLPAALAGETLERLFFTPQEREYLEKLRWVPPESLALVQKQPENAAVVESKPQVYTLAGTVTRRNGVQAVWLNGVRYSETDLPANVELHRPLIAGQVLLHVPESGKSYALRPGQTLDIGDGRIRESYERPAVASRPKSPPDQVPAQLTEPSSEPLQIPRDPSPSKPRLAVTKWPLAEISN